ncbi:hypothetical protein vseg_003686 [Gypsophila vaccaria]
MGEKPEKNTKNNEAEKKNDGGGANTIVLQFDMHCEGCAKKVRRSLMKFQGVESVKTDCSTNKLVVTGKVDPVKVKERVEEKIKKTVALVSLQPNKAAAKEGGTTKAPKEGGNGKGGGGGDGEKKKSDDKKPEEKKSDAKSDDKKKSEEKVKEKPKEPTVATVQLKTKVHCEGCAQKIKKIVGRCEGVQDVNVDLAKDLITAKGTMNMKDLLPYLNVKLKRSVELAPTKNSDTTSADKKPKEGGDKSEKPQKSSGEKKDASANKKSDAGDKKDCNCDKKDAGGEKKKGASGEGAGPSNDNGPKIEVNKMEYNPYGYDHAYSYAYDPRQQGDGYGHQVVEYWHAPEYSQPPQLFSDENPNACTVM